MQLTARTRDIRVSDAVVEFARERIDRHLGRLRRHIRSVSVLFESQSRSSRLPERRCQVAVQMADGQQVIVRQGDRDLYDAISAAVRRARHAVVRAAGRRRGKHRAA